MVLYLCVGGGAICAAFGLWTLAAANNTAASFVAISGVARVVAVRSDSG